MLALIGDGSSMYTIQALWTLAREKLNVTAIIFNNASYSVLNVELERVGAEDAGPKAKAQLDLHGPVLNFTQIAEGMGVRTNSPVRPKKPSRSRRLRTLRVVVISSSTVRSRIAAMSPGASPSTSRSSTMAR